MSNFHRITYLDTFAVVAQLHKLAPHTWNGMRYRGEIGDERLPVKSLELRIHEKPSLENWLEDLPVVDMPVMEKWKSMQSLLAKARKAILSDPAIKASGALDPSAPIDRVMISGLEPQGCITWHEDNGPYHERHVRFHVPLVTNPNVVMYSGMESVHMPVGSLFLFNNRVKHSACNWGLHTRYHLIFEMAKASVGDDD